jgi:hypothetical protein
MNGWNEIKRISELPLRDNLMENLGHEFWTRLDELVGDIEEYGYRVTDFCDEYVVVENDTEDESTEVILYLGHANTTIWIERAKEN